MSKCELCGRETADTICIDCLDRLERNADAKQYRLETPRRKRICAAVSKYLVLLLLLDAGLVWLLKLNHYPNDWFPIMLYWCILTAKNLSDWIGVRK